LQRDDTEIAIRELEKSVAVAPYIARGHNALGDAYGRAAQKAGIFSQFNLARKSRSEYERAVELEPDNVDFHTSLFEYFLQAPSLVGGGFDHATTEADAIKQLDAKSGHQAYARLYAAQAKYDQALTELNAVLKTDPNDYATLYQVGRTAAVSGQHFEEGLASLRHCLQLATPTGSPDHAAVQWRIGNILEKKGDSAGAREAYESALKMDPKFAPATESLAKLKSADVSRKS
jgi:tetratricopeptide (TPR) repeat protein